MVRPCDSLAQVKLTVQHHIPVEDDGMPESDTDVLPREALIECTSIFRQAIAASTRGACPLRLSAGTRMLSRTAMTLGPRRRGR